jgi:hypothetical protein
MTFLNDCPQGRSQFLTKPDTRKLALGWLGLASYVQFPVIPANLPQPEFFIGDKVADHWIDEFECESVEYGKVVGICWHPRQETWAYLIDWFKGGSPDFLYPCFDGHLVIGGDLRALEKSNIPDFLGGR